MAKPVQRRVSRLRRVFRWCRIFILLLILAVVVAGIYLNTIGVPNFLKRPLLAKLRDAGVQVDFQRMRLRWYRGIVVDHATFTFLKNPLQPKFFSDETELNPNLRSLRDPHFKLNSIAVKNGTLVWPVSKTDSRSLIVSNIDTRIAFRPGGEIATGKLEADFAGVNLAVSGIVTNFSEARDWKIFQRKTPTGKGGLQRFADVLEKIHLAGSPEIQLQLSGDAAAPENFKGNFSFVAPEVQSPWGNGTNLQLAAELRGFSGSSGNTVARVKAGSAETPWGGASNVNGVVKLSFFPDTSNGFLANVKFSAKQFHVKQCRARSVQLTAHSPLSFTNFFPTNITGNLNVTGAETKWGNAASAEITFSAATNSAPKIADATWGAWRFAEPFFVNWDGRFTKINSPKLTMEKFSCAGTWRAPELQISKFNADLYEGKATASVELNIATRKVHGEGASDFDAQKLSPLLTPFGKRWIAKFTYEKPPKLNGDLRVTLPAWTNHAPNWRAEVLPTLQLNGHVEVGSGTYRGVSATAAKTDFAFSNMVWTLPHLRVDRPEGGADLHLVADDRAHEYHWQINSRMDPKAIRHLLAEKQQRVFDEFQFPFPPVVRAELNGHWHELEDIAIEGEIVATNFSFRSNLIDKFVSAIQLTNEVLSFKKARLDRGNKFISADDVTLDFPARRIYFTNGYGNDDPYLVTRLIGPKVAAHMAPYQFAEPPAIRVDGNMSLTNIDDVDLHFLVEGSSFQWKNSNADKISGRLDWINQTLLVTNLHARAYRDGTVEGWAYFDFAPSNGTDFRFDFAAADVDLPLLIKGLTGKTNRLEGLLYGQFTLDSGNTRDPKTWKGHGRANLSDGLIWDVPIFGIFSPVLNALIPGAGNSRAREGSATYLVRDGMVYSDDLEIRAAGLRLQYRGAVDFEKQVDARVEAQLLRDTWIIGPLVSLALSPISKIFEYKVTGTLSNPKSEPVYVPDLLMMTLRPFHSLKEIFLPEKNDEKPPENSDEKKP